MKATSLPQLMNDELNFVTLELPFHLWSLWSWSYCGESIKTIQKVFVVCERTLYEFQSLSKGVDTAFKIFHATGSQYPQESYDNWLLIQIAFYEVQTKYDRPAAAVKLTLVDLGLKNRLIWRASEQYLYCRNMLRF